MNNEGGYIRSLDGLRAVAIVLVMSFHADITHFGWMGVQLFFVLSGFLITGILWREKQIQNSLSYKFKKFWVRRSLRIFPLYFGYLIAIGIIYLLFHFPSYYTTYAPYLFTYTFNYTRTLLQWQGNPLFTHLWSLSIEEQFYLFFPVIVFLCPPKFVKFLMIAVICIAPVTRFLLGEYYKSKGLVPEVIADAVYWNTLSHLDAFFMGGLIPVLSLHKKIKKPKPLFFISAIVVIAAGIINFIFTNSNHLYITDLGYNHGQTQLYEHVWHYTLLNILFASFILLLVSNQTQHSFLKLRQVLESKWMVRVGRVSYGMYIFHWAVLVYFYNRIIITDNIYLKPLLFIPYVVIVFFVAEMSYNFYEIHFLKLKEKLFTSKTIKSQNHTKNVSVEQVSILNKLPNE